MNFLRDYRNYLLEKKPQAIGVQFFWLAISAGIIGYSAWNAANMSALRTVALVIIAFSIAVDAATNVSYHRSKRLFEKLVYVKIGANITSLLTIVVFVVLMYKFKL
jgi:hypothetical protein